MEKITLNWALIGDFVISKFRSFTLSIYKVFFFFFFFKEINIHTQGKEMRFPQNYFSSIEEELKTYIRYHIKVN